MKRDLRSGFTTGTCAAAAAKAATARLCGREAAGPVRVELLNGESIAVRPEFICASAEGCEAAVRKDAGDDPDITNGMLIKARVRFNGSDAIAFAGGEGVGTVTLSGLQIPPGEPAINPGPRRMIQRAVREVTEKGVDVEIAVPGGEEVAARTFNPRLGVKGGLSILGTTGIVRPYSHAALREALVCALDIAGSCGIDAPILVPGNIGRRAAERYFNCRPRQVVEVSNEWGFMLDALAERAFGAALVVGHPGKLGKLSMGYWDTHSRRSPAAVPLLIELARARGIAVDEKSATGEGLFMSIPSEQRRRLGDTLAGNVRDTIRGRLPRHIGVGVVLTSMNGEILGAAGEMRRWK